MGFIDSYKRLEKLCGEILSDDRRVSAYIDEMLNTPNGSFYVETWDEDLKNLKHYRWVRNKISHDPDCSESNMCDSEDEIWIENFRSRIMNQTDPLSLYREARAYIAANQQKQTSISNKPSGYNCNHYSTQKRRSYVGIIIFGLILLAVIFLLSNKLY